MSLTLEEIEQYMKDSNLLHEKKYSKLKALIQTYIGLKDPVVKRTARRRFGVPSESSFLRPGHIDVIEHVYQDTQCISQCLQRSRGMIIL